MGSNGPTFILEFNHKHEHKGKFMQSIHVKIIDTCHEKTDLKVLVVVIPKEGLAGWAGAPPILFCV